MTKEYPWGKGTPRWVRDATANDSDKSFTVPVGKIFDVQSIHVEITTTATVGNRALSVFITNGTDVISVLGRTGSIAATQSGVLFVSRNGPVTATTGFHPLLSGASGNAALVSQSAPLILPAGYVIRCWDLSAIDAAADDMTVVLHYVEYDA